MKFGIANNFWKSSTFFWQKIKICGKFCKIYGKCWSLVTETVPRIVVSVSNIEVIKPTVSVLSSYSHHICQIRGPYFDNNLFFLHQHLIFIIKNLKFYGIAMWNTRWFKYDRDWFVCKQAALRSSCSTLRERSHNLYPPSCSG